MTSMKVTLIKKFLKCLWIATCAGCVKSKITSNQILEYCKRSQQENIIVIQLFFHSGSYNYFSHCVLKKLNLKDKKNRDVSVYNEKLPFDKIILHMLFFVINNRFVNADQLILLPFE